MVTTAKAQGVTLREIHFRRDGDDPDRFRLKEIVGGDDDVIHLKMEKVPELENKVEIVVASSSNVRWWKGITIFKGIIRGNSLTDTIVRYKHMDTQDDDHSESSRAINISDLGDYCYLVFEKAKAFGVHSEMYRFYLKERKDATGFKYAGYRLTFTWERDG